MEVTETVLIAFITLMSSLVGAVAGAFGVIWSTKNSSKAQLQKIVVESYFKARLEAFQHVFAAYAELEKTPLNKECVLTFKQTVNSACLIASPTTAERLRLFQMAATDGRDAGLRRVVLEEAVSAMQNDLKTYQEPVVGKIG